MTTNTLLKTREILFKTREIKTREIMLDGIPGDEPLVKGDVVAKYLGIAGITIRKKVMHRQIPYYKIGGAVRFRMSEIREWREEQHHEVTKKATMAALVDFSNQDNDEITILQEMQEDEYNDDREE
jgi:excisionase family DNA binding protein